MRKAEESKKMKDRSRRTKESPRNDTEQHGKIQFVNTLHPCNSGKIRGEKKLELDANKF